MQSAQPVFNNNDRMEIEDKDFYQNLQMYKYHSGFVKEGIYILSFALKPEELQPSGTQNFSRLDNQEFRINIFNTYPIEQRFNCYMWRAFIHKTQSDVIGRYGCITGYIFDFSFYLLTFI